MKFIETTLSGAYIIEPEPIEDERGFFARTFCRDEFLAYGLNPCVVQCNISFNKRKGTLRGMHYQEEPHAEVKIVRCTRGAIADVIVDIRPDSPTFKKWTAVELTAENRTMLYVPEGFAPGLQTLCDDTEVFYQMSVCYNPQSARTLRWDDPAIGIIWPIAEKIMSHGDRAAPYDICDGKFETEVAPHAGAWIETTKADV